ncbi:methyltransferase [Rugosibacter aromaticivorans]|uniref:Methyltransferase n=1 Tax=Rugosibacter aromaticivorans TaxID=1565605 RepID=A0A0C5J7A5_9PROT|nr:16S rRNA (guanine(966)-N(2))-methyltransferase RsmD [Rugosibacter aromaticivorans]AJP47524.1 methyltransferase [Rugosibacter aromaticivorans]TBR12996.1 MAG: 16S rRNA (guanine(966)-N(2))-methyltransferase RsmD [Rugosibacter sp.]
MSQIRITGGEWRSRRLQVTDAPGLRPTPDRVRETLFNWLGHDLSGLSCLDLFAGSGVLGIEAASRGASYVACVEQSRHVFHTLKKNLDNFAGARIQLFLCDALEFIPPTGKRFDLLFLDPPYGQGWPARIAPRLDELATPAAHLYVEAEAPLTQLGRWSVRKAGQAGQVYFHLLEAT